MKRTLLATLLAAPIAVLLALPAWAVDPGNKYDYGTRGNYQSSGSSTVNTRPSSSSNSYNTRPNTSNTSNTRPNVSSQGSERSESGWRRR